MNIDAEVLSVDLSIVNSNRPVRFTANNTRAIHSGKIIQLYQKFDRRVLPLLRLFRIFSKVSFSFTRGTINFS
jgi:hypothetical protein